MASSTLEAIPDSAAVFVDAPIFIYHFTGVSASCRDFLGRCEVGEIRGVTSAVMLAEVTHRLMMMEAVRAGKVSPGNVPAKLRKRPDVVRELHLYQEQAEKIPLMGVTVEPLELRTLLQAGPLRRRTGLLTNDSLAAATARHLEIPRIASADSDFDSLEGLVLHRPSDL
jgi:predicted nucleic acid-binding protein